MYVSYRSTETGDERYMHTRDPELLARWLMEQLRDLPPSEIAPAQIRIWPQSKLAEGVWKYDWPEPDGWPVRVIAGDGSAPLRELAKQLLATAESMDAPAEEDDEQDVPALPQQV